MLQEYIKNAVKEILLGDTQTNTNQDHPMIGEKVIIRTYSAGVHYGELHRKDGSEVILINSRRMWRWMSKKSISLSGVANYGIKHEESKICPVVSELWLDAIEIIPCTDEAIKSIESAKDVEAS